jgi:hypothetical protein
VHLDHGLVHDRVHDRDHDRDRGRVHDPEAVVPLIDRTRRQTMSG